MFEWNLSLTLNSFTKFTNLCWLWRDLSREVSFAKTILGNDHMEKEKMHHCK